MPFGTIKIQGGVNTVKTATLNQAGISTSNLIRFRDDLVEKVGGWLQFSPMSMGSITRCLHAWQDLSGNKWLVAGNLLSVQAMSGGAAKNIMPQTLTSNCALNLSTIQGDNLIVIVDTNVNTLSPNSSVFFNTPISVGGITLTGMEDMVATPAPSGTTYRIHADNFATATVNNGGTVPQFTTSANSAIVSVVFANHGLSDGGKFVLPIATSVGGLTLVGVYEHIEVSDSNTFTLTASNQAAFNQTASMNGGMASYFYGIAPGQVISSAFGGMGAIGQFAIGEGFVKLTTSAYQTGTKITAADWAMDNWGEILLGCPRGGMIWYWPPNDGFTGMVPVAEGPAFNNGIFVAMPAQILVAWGSTSSIESGNTDAAQDPLIVRWSDQLDFFTWDVTSRTQAGSFHIPTGSEIRAGIQGATQAYIFTDIDCWAMQYLGYPLVFGFNQIGTGCGIVGPHAVVNLYGQTFWMNDTNFFVIGAGQGVQEIPCPVWDTVFQDIDTTNISKCVAAANSQFNEITFYYPSASGGTGECDKYAKFHTKSGEWDVGSLKRSAWVDKSIVGGPIGADPSTLLVQQHEVGYSDNGAAIDSYFETGYTAYGDGEQFAVIDYFEPDMKWNTVGSSSAAASISVTITAAKSPNDPNPMVYGPVTMTSTTQYLTPRLRGRQIKWKMETNDATSWWRLGDTRYRFTLDGRR